MRGMMLSCMLHRQKLKLIHAHAVEGFNGSAWSLTAGEHENATIFLRPHDEAAQSLALQRLKV